MRVKKDPCLSLGHGKLFLSFGLWRGHNPEGNYVEQNILNGLSDKRIDCVGGVIMAPPPKYIAIPMLLLSKGSHFDHFYNSNHILKIFQV